MNSVYRSLTKDFTIIYFLVFVTGKSFEWSQFSVLEILTYRVSFFLKSLKIFFRFMVMYEVHFKSNAHSDTKPTQCVLKKSTSVFCVVFQTRQCSVNVCVYCAYNVDMSDTSGYVTKQDQRSYVKIKTLHGPLFWTPTCGKYCSTPLFSRHESLPWN